ncbi:MAG: sigma-70 family RNA polymerase sigma factor [Blastocatellia bacterium]|nr:sigma-70 family RNA polymerase sigma factor [Blastocatellia bacterium]
MDTGDFIARYEKTIAALWKTVASTIAKSYGVTRREFSERLAAVVLRSGNHAESSPAGDGADDGNSKANHHNNGNSNNHNKDRAEEILAGIKANELCLAIACERGDEVAWRKLETEYRYSMQAAARALTKDEAEAEDLIQFVFGELYGVRMDGDRRLSKFSYYSGRGSLGGWLRAVVYQCFIDRKRLTARFEQVEEVEELDRLANAAVTHFHGTFSAPLASPDEFDDVRLRRATEEAMTQAFAEIDARDRLLLNYYFFDDLTLREIGLLMGVHEATICRWLARAQREVKSRTEDILKRSYGLRRSEVAECLQLAARAELDVRKLLSEVKGPTV